MKKTLSYLFALSILLVSTMSFVVLSDNGKAGYTGSPGELKCNDCHNSFTINTGGGSVYISSTNMNNWQYVPGQVYNMKVTVKKTGVSLFGVGLEALTPSNTNAGTITVTSTTKAQLKNANVSSVLRSNLVHKLNGGADPDSSVFTFNWTAPATNVGNVTFYFAGVAANGNGDEFSDYVYNSSRVITPFIATSIEEQSNVPFLTSINYNASDRSVVVNTNIEKPQTATIEFFDLQGRKVFAENGIRLNAGQSTNQVDVSSILKSGIYIVNIRTEEFSQSKRIPIIF
jgi:hypothetical protein